VSNKLLKRRDSNQKVSINPGATHRLGRDATLIELNSKYAEILFRGTLGTGRSNRLGVTTVGRG
jgi:hypothetical protein